MEYVTCQRVAVAAAAATAAYALWPSAPSELWTPLPAQSAPDFAPYPPAGADTYGVIEPHAGRAIQYAQRGVSSQRFPPIPQVFEEICNKYSDKPALCYEKNPQGPTCEWTVVTWGQYLVTVRRFAKALLKLVDFQRFEAVAICGFNSPEWFYAHLGVMMAGGMSAGTYTTNSPEACRFIAAHSNSRLVCVDSVRAAQKYITVRAQLPNVKHVVVWGEPIPEDLKQAQGNFILSWSEFLEAGDSVQDAVLSERRSQIRVEDCAGLIYTSGTTGDPKGVMISHDNYSFSAAMAQLSQGDDMVEDRASISYLPLSHIAAQILDIALPLYCLWTDRGQWPVYFARPDALRGSLGQTIKSVRPTAFFGVPRVFEKFVETMKAKAKENPLTGIKAKLVAWSRSVLLQYSRNRQVGGNGNRPAGLAIAQKLLEKKAKSLIGFDRTTRFSTGAAPIAIEVLEFLAAIGINVNEVYGMSESTGMATCCQNMRFKFGSCGAAYLGLELKIDHVFGRDADGEGEICYRGRSIMLGYLHNIEKTREAIDNEGWLHSGDIGRVDAQGMYYITGRIKELVIGAGGENIAPVPIENELKRLMPALSNVILVGDKRKYNVILVTIKTKPSLETGGFTDELVNEALDVNRSITSLPAAVRDPVWKAYVEAGIKKYNNGSTCVSNASKVQKFAFLPADVSIPGGELTPTMKLKRNVVNQKYAEIVDQLYAEDKTE